MAQIMQANATALITSSSNITYMQQKTLLETVKM
jgi:hypothetical protein